jgi:enoyl-CoA hydratase/carnithine racemase
LHERAALLTEAQRFAADLAQGPWFAHAMTKKMLDQEWSMSIDQLLEAEAQAQAICMATGDFRRAFDAFAAKTKPRFKGD